MKRCAAKCFFYHQVKMSIQERVKKEDPAKLWGNVVTKEDLEGYENIKKAEEIERHERGTG